jgi:hypothetical protein
MRARDESRERNTDGERGDDCERRDRDGRSASHPKIFIERNRPLESNRTQRRCRDISRV